jgi:hypothetical protein
LKITTSFAANYQVELSAASPSGAENTYYFPPQDQAARPLYEVSLKFMPFNKQAWWGVFAARSRQERGLSTVCTMPTPDSCFISCVGTGYVVNVNNPREWQVVQLHPVICVTEQMMPPIMVLSGFTRMLAYDTSGFMWRSEPLCSDQLEVISVDRSTIKFRGWDAPTSQTLVRQVDTSSGELK